MNDRAGSNGTRSHFLDGAQEGSAQDRDEENEPKGEAGGDGAKKRGLWIRCGQDGVA
jgi:hypothetical protein